VLDELLPDAAEDPVGFTAGNAMNLGTATGGIIGLMGPKDERLKPCMAIPPR
jgi:hypothetical protein